MNRKVQLPRMRAVRRRREELLALSRKLIDAHEADRGHIARELHDEIGQVLTAVSLNLCAFKALLAPADLPRLEESIGLVDYALQRVRTMSLDLRPALLDDLGLVAALRSYVDRQSQRAGLTAHFTADPPETHLPRDLTDACFRIAQEAVTNVVRHARARHVWLDFRQTSEGVELVVRDDGAGFEPAVALRDARTGRTFGLLGMRERARLLGGQIAIESWPGRGSTLRARLPVGSAVSDDEGFAEGAGL